MRACVVDKTKMVRNGTGRGKNFNYPTTYLNLLYHF